MVEPRASHNGSTNDWIARAVRRLKECLEDLEGLDGRSPARHRKMTSRAEQYRSLLRDLIEQEETTLRARLKQAAIDLLRAKRGIVNLSSYSRIGEKLPSCSDWDRVRETSDVSDAADEHSVRELLEKLGL